MTNIVEYVGRKVDVLAFRGVFPTLVGREQLLCQELATPTDGGMIVAGIEKFVQVFLITLLTQKGSKVLDPTFGTTFMIEAMQGQWRTVADVTQSFYSSCLDAKVQIQAEELTTDPPDERYGSVTLTNVTLNGDTITIGLNIITLANTSYTFLVPITVPIL